MTRKMTPVPSNPSPDRGDPLRVELSEEAVDAFVGGRIRLKSSATRRCFRHCAGSSPNGLWKPNSTSTSSTETAATRAMVTATRRSTPTARAPPGPPWPLQAAADRALVPQAGRLRRPRPVPVRSGQGHARHRGPDRQPAAGRCLARADFQDRRRGERGDCRASEPAPRAGHCQRVPGRHLPHDPRGRCRIEQGGHPTSSLRPPTASVQPFPLRPRDAFRGSGEDRPGPRMRRACVHGFLDAAEPDRPAPHLFHGAAGVASVLGEKLGTPDHTSCDARQPCPPAPPPTLRRRPRARHLAARGDTRLVSSSSRRTLTSCLVAG